MPRKRVADEQPRARLVWVLPDGSIDVESPGPNRAAADRVVAAFRAASTAAAERLAAVQRAAKVSTAAGDPLAGEEAMLVAFVSLATAVDAAPTDARLWAQYRDADTLMRARLKEATAANGDGDWTAAAAAVGSAPVRNTTRSKPRDARPEGGRGGAKARQGADAASGARVGRRPRG